VNKALRYIFYLFILGLTAERSELHALESPFQGTLRVSYRSLSSQTEPILIVRAAHIEGFDEIIFRKVVKTERPKYLLNRGAVESSKRPVLYKGTLRRSREDRISRASADIINGRLRVIFHGRRRGRLISMTKDLKEARIEAKSRFISSFRRFKCGAEEGAASHSLTEKQISSVMAATSAQLGQTLLLSMSADSDFEFYRIYGNGTFGEIESILNSVDSIFLSQLNLDLNVKDIEAFSDDSQPYTSSDGETLLNQFRAYNNLGGRLKAADAYHLFTGKTLKPAGMVGLSFVGAFCREGGTYSYGLTQYFPSPVQVIITAHEIAHGLGATHTDSGIMLANLSSNPREFSSFSVDEISSYIDRYGTCLSLATPTVTLNNVSYSRKGRFQATLTPGGNVSGTCEMALYGSSREAYLNMNRIFKRARRISSYTIESGTRGQRLNVLVKPNSKATKKVFLRAVLSCGTMKGLSKIASVKVRNKKVVQFLSLLAQGLETTS